MRPPVLALLLAGACGAAPAIAGELTPYPPPVQQQAVPIPPRQQVIQQPARVPESTYLRFEDQVRALPAKERALLARSFEEQRAQAVSTGDVARELHYLRLLDVLRRTGGGKP